MPLPSSRVLPALALALALLAFALAGGAFAATPRLPEPNVPAQPLPESVLPHVPKILARLPDCAVFAPPPAAAGHFHDRLHDICAAIAMRVDAGRTPNSFDLYGAIQLRSYLVAVARLQTFLPAALGVGAASPPPLSEASAYLIARQHKLFALHRAMFDAPSGALAAADTDETPAAAPAAD